MMRRLSLIGIDDIWQLSLGCLLMRNIASFLRYTGYLNFINGPISHVLLLILVHVQGSKIVHVRSYLRVEVR